MASFEDEVSGAQVLTHETPETAPWKSESAIVALKRVTTVERRAGR